MRSSEGDDLRARWTGEGESLRDEIFARLSKGHPLDGLPIERHDGRLDLRGIAAPEEVPVSSRDLSIRDRIFRFDRVSAVPQIRSAALRGVDLSGARLSGVMVVDSTIENCRFDGVRWHERGFWGSTIRDSSFRGANLRAFVMGGASDRATTGERVDFDEALLDDVIPGSSDFIDCDFGRARLRKFEAYGCRLVRCRFAGRLDEVIFSAVGSSGSSRRGVLEDVDFSAASFRFVSLRGFELEGVRVPEGPGHIRFRDYPCVLRRAIDHLRSTEDPDELWLLGLLEHDQQWLGPNQRQGVLAIGDLHELERIDAGQRFAEWLRQLDGECVRSPFAQSDDP